MKKNTEKRKAHRKRRLEESGSWHDWPPEHSVIKEGRMPGGARARRRKGHFFRGVAGGAHSAQHRVRCACGPETKRPQEACALQHRGHRPALKARGQRVGVGALKREAADADDAERVRTSWQRAALTADRDVPADFGHVWGHASEVEDGHRRVAGERCHCLKNADKSRNRLTVEEWGGGGGGTETTPRRRS